APSQSILFQRRHSIQDALRDSQSARRLSAWFSGLPFVAPAVSLLMDLSLDEAEQRVGLQGDIGTDLAHHGLEYYPHGFIGMAFAQPSLEQKTHPGRDCAMKLFERPLVASADCIHELLDAFNLSCCRGALWVNVHPNPPATCR